jgi:TolB protein
MMRPLVVVVVLVLGSLLVAADPPKPSAPPAPTSTTPPTPPAAGGHGHGAPSGPPEKTPVMRADEKHLKNVQQLTAGGENAEAYFDQTGKELILQTKRGDAKCDEIFRMSADGKNQRRVSPSVAEKGGRTTCSFIRPDGKILYSSTHAHGAGCLDEPDRSKGYVWKIYPEMDVWIADGDGKNAKVLFQSPGYDAEATVCHKDGRIVFTSSKDGDLELYVTDPAMKDIKRVTSTPGYDGGAFFSEDCTKLVWRASRPTGSELAEYQALLKESLVRPSKLEIFVADIDAKNVVTNVKQVTKNGKANFAPYLHPDNKRVLWASNQHDPKGRDFDIFMINIDGTNEQRITTNPSFDGFPMFTPDGKKLVFASNRNQTVHGETNVFIADWVE